MICPVVIKVSLAQQTDEEREKKRKKRDKNGENPPEKTTALVSEGFFFQKQNKRSGKRNKRSFPDEPGTFNDPHLHTFMLERVFEPGTS